MEDTHKHTDVFSQLEMLKKTHFDSSLKWYKNHSRLPRILFRLVGVIIIILSVSIPFLTTVKFTGSEVVLSVAALLVAALSGINSFLQFDYKWRSNKQTELALEYLNSLYNLRLVEAKNMADKEKAKEYAFKITQQLLEDARAVTSINTEKFFENVRLPDTFTKTK